MGETVFFDRSREFRDRREFGIQPAIAFDADSRQAVFESQFLRPSTHNVGVTALAIIVRDSLV
jgi:hypothetical protein